MKISNKGHFFFILFFTSLTCFTQSFHSGSGEVTYKVVSNRFSDTISNKKLAEHFKKLAEHFENLEYELKFNRIESSYMLKKSMKNDGINAFHSGYAEIVAGNHKIYVNIRDKLILKQNEIHGKLFLISDSINNNWTIFKKSKKIGQYNCYMAEKISNNNKVIAWFTNEISVPFGPDEYTGLPGLIIKLETPHVIYYMDKILFYKKQKIINKLEKGIRKTKAEYKKYLKDKIDKDGYKKAALKRLKKS